MNKDWRLLNYDERLDGSIFELKSFEKIGNNDHEHCILCWKRITDIKIDTEDDCEGYCCFNQNTQQENWICKDCFNEFQNHFGWKVKKPNSQNK